MTNGIGDSDNQYIKNLERLKNMGYDIENIKRDDALYIEMCGMGDFNEALTKNIDAGVEESVFRDYITNNFGYTENLDFMVDYLDENNDGMLDSNELNKMKSEDSRPSHQGEITAFTIGHYFANIIPAMKENYEDYADYIAYRDAFNNGEIDEQVIIGSFNDGSISKNVAEALAEDLDIDGTNASNEEPTSEWNDTVKNEVEEYLGNFNNLDNKFKAAQVEEELRKKYSDPALTQALALLDEACNAATNNQGTENQTPVAEGEEAPVEQAPADTIELDNDEVPKADYPNNSTDFNEGLTNAISIEAGEPLNIEIIGKEGGYADLNEDVKNIVKEEILPLLDGITDLDEAEKIAADWANNNVIPELVSSFVIYSLIEAGFDMTKTGVVLENNEGNPEGLYNFDDVLRSGVCSEIQKLDGKTLEEKMEAVKEWASANCTSTIYPFALIYANDLISGRDVIIPEEFRQTDVAEETESTTETQTPVSTPSQTENAQKKHAILSEDQQNLIQNSVKDLIAQGKSEKDQIVEIVVSSFQEAYQDDFTAEMEEEIKQTTEYYYYDNIS